MTNKTLTKEEILEIIREKCGLKELRFGCEFQVAPEHEETHQVAWETIGGDYVSANDAEEYDREEITIIGLPVHLEHLLFALFNHNENEPKLFSVRYSLANELIPKGIKYVDFIGVSNEDLIYKYDLTKTVEQNLENPELLNLIGELLNK